jgi:arylsulfatase A-like enzyme
MHRLKPYLRRIRSLRASEWKLIWGSDGKHELYNIHTDPEETTNLVNSEPQRVRELIALMETRLRELKGPAYSLEKESISINQIDLPALDTEVEEQLRSLGYAQ